MKINIQISQSEALRLAAALRYTTENIDPIEGDDNLISDLEKVGNIVLQADKNNTRGKEECEIRGDKYPISCHICANVMEEVSDLKDIKYQRVIRCSKCGAEVRFLSESDLIETYDGKFNREGVKWNKEI